MRRMQLLLIAPDTDLGRDVAGFLTRRGHRVDWRTGWSDLGDAAHDVALLDLDAAGPEGRAWLLRWRQEGPASPVIVFTGRTLAHECARGLRLGADDCLAKPFDLDELDARIGAVTRRACGPRGTGARAGVGPLRVDRDARRAWRGQTPVELTHMEWAVLDALARHRGRIYSRGEIEDHLHDHGLTEARSNSLEVIVARLRRKLGAPAISTHRGLGYRLDDGPQPRA